LHADEVIALWYGVPDYKRRSMADEILVRLDVEQKVDLLVRIAAEVFGGDHVTPTFLRNHWRNVKTARNRIDHGYLTTVDPKAWSVTLQTGIKHKGHQPHDVSLPELGQRTAEAEDIVRHVVCVYAALRDPTNPMDYNDLE